MANFYDGIDLRFTNNGDFVISEGDLQDTSHDSLLSIVQDIQTVAKSVFNDWEMYPNYAAGLDDFIGEPNSRETGLLLKERIRLALIAAGIVLEDDLKVFVFPIHRKEVSIVIKIAALATPFNFLSAGEGLTVYFVYDYLEKGVMFLYEPVNLINDVG